MCDRDGNLYEGLSSNFAAIDMQNRLVTASNKHVLCGTIMEVAKHVAKHALAMPVVDVFPSIEGLCSGQYRYAFITSTSRLVLPINTIHLPDGSQVHLNPPTLTDGEGADGEGADGEGADGEGESVMLRLQRLVEEQVAARASLITSPLNP
jgi:branched-subunit amino acid aminotransferase/4-amino-4-deoxychorismate lyase